MLRNKSKQLWKAINPNPTKTLSLLDEHGDPIPEHITPEVLNSAFSSIFTPGSFDPPHITFDSYRIAKLIDELKLKY
ncbi:hypothetical protein HPB48_019223 [Haemaphysalis longicornis]|uniref:Uncharacterized protein n=1 Tax=Haemaphysalis longicornis TaxID=44386 RepID=A0A9J6GCS9_HAELO|nr:hypothetical protein HPB48_019223 [Haemaphysalis longicornis]